MKKSKQRRKVRIGLLGSGAVGEAIQDFVFGDLKGRIGSDIKLEIVKIYTPHPKDKKRKKRWRAAYPGLFTTKPKEVTRHPKIEIVVEALGSKQESQLAGFRNFIVDAMKDGKDVATSDKAVLVKYGKELWSAARRCGRQLRFEACVGGGIPIVRSLSESLTSEEPEAIYGIMNGTCNYILSRMGQGKTSFAEALREAQQQRYAETNPVKDVSGTDAEAKLLLLAAVTFGLHIKPGSIWLKGIEQIHAIDFRYADERGGCTIKQLAVAKKDDGAIQAFVSPVLVPNSHFLSAIAGPTNAIFFRGRRSEDAPGAERPEDMQAQGRRDWNYAFVGPGAGGGATSVAVLGDVCDLARGRLHPLPGPPNLTVSGKITLQPVDEIRGSFYLRFIVKDQPGIVGDICRVLGRERINVSEVWQLGHSEEELKELRRAFRLKARLSEMLPFAITAEETTLGRMKRALQTIQRQGRFNLQEPLCIPIWRG